MSMKYFSDKEGVNNGSISFKISADLTPEQDAAHANLGGNWRMPTKAECQELIDNCDASWTDDYNGTGVIGYIFISKINGNSVFLPVTGYGYCSSVNHVGSDGYYWSASRDDFDYAWYLGFDSGEQGVYYNGRFFGQPVRGVCK